MTMTDPVLQLDAARTYIARKSFGPERERDAGPETPGRIGLEPEYFVVRDEAIGTPAGRPRLFGTAEQPGLIDWLDAASERSHDFTSSAIEGGVPRYDLACGGQLTFEPGGQVEHSTRVHDNAIGAMDDLVRVRGILTDLFAAEGCSTVALGVDPWHRVDDVPQQLPGGRYRAQAEFYERKGRFGRVMMRHSTSVQINLDFGDDARVAEERWAIANLVGPLITATFSTSPGRIRSEEGTFASRRAYVWRTLDPTRTGYSRGFVESALGDGSDMGLAYADQVLDADVMLFQRPGFPDGMATGGPGFTFREWIERGHPEHGAATQADLDYHMTTVFPEVRARGFMELRAADGLPLDLVGPFVVYLTGLVYDPTARGEALRVLEPHRKDLDALWYRAAKEGLADTEVCGLCRWVWTLALEGAARMGKDYFRPEDLVAAEAFLERFVMDCRSTSDELDELLARAPREALAWHK